MYTSKADRSDSKASLEQEQRTQDEKIDIQAYSSQQQAINTTISARKITEPVSGTLGDYGTMGNAEVERTTLQK